MIRCRNILPLLGLALAACAPAPKQQPAPPQAVTTGHGPTDPAGRQPFKKPVRMNGRGAISSIGLGDFYPLQQAGKALIYDARPAFFYHLGHIPGARNLSKTDCDATIAARESEIKAALAAGKTIVVYCSSAACPDARTVAIHLAGFGYPSSIFSAGWDGWREAAMTAE